MKVRRISKQINEGSGNFTHRGDQKGIKLGFVDCFGELFIRLRVPHQFCVNKNKSVKKSIMTFVR